MRYYSSTAVAMALTGAVNEIVTTIVVDTVLGLPAQTPFALALDVGLSTEEIVTVTNVSGTNLTVTRGEDGTSAIAHTIGAVTRHMVTARDLREPQEHLAATANVHGIGATASVVGTDTAQTLTHKTVNFADNTILGVPQASVTDLVDDLAALTAADGVHGALTAAHGATGAVVGTTNVQTLTNKTLSAPVVTAPPSNIHNPIGTLLIWAGDVTAPTGYLIADGALVSRTTYSALFAVIGTMHGEGDGFTTFNLPSLSGRVIVGFDATQTEFDAMGETGGAKTHILSAAEMPSHTHIQNAHNHIQDAHDHSLPHAQVGAAGAEVYPVATGVGGTRSGLATATNQAATAVNQATGGGGAHNNLQPYIVLRYIIKF